MACRCIGTTFRSLLSWDIRTTAVELVPSVPTFFGFFHRNGSELLASPRARVVIDDYVHSPAIRTTVKGLLFTLTAILVVMGTAVIVTFNAGAGG